MHNFENIATLVVSYAGEIISAFNARIVETQIAKGKAKFTFKVPESHARKQIYFIVIVKPKGLTGLDIVCKMFNAKTQKMFNKKRPATGEKFVMLAWSIADILKSYIYHESKTRKKIYLRKKNAKK